MSLEEARAIRDEITEKTRALDELRRSHREAERAEMESLRTLQRRYRDLIEAEVNNVEPADMGKPADVE